MVDKGVSRPLWIQITACGFAAVLFSCLSIGGLAINRQYRAMEERIGNDLDNDIAFIQSEIAAQTRVATGLALTMAGEPGLGELIEAGKRDEIINRFKTNFDAVKREADLQLITFMSASQTAVARIHTPDKFGDNVSGRRQTVGEALSRGRLVTGIEPGLTSLSVFATAPVSLRAGSSASSIPARLSHRRSSRGSRLRCTPTSPSCCFMMECSRSRIRPFRASPS